MYLFFSLANLESISQSLSEAASAYRAKLAELEPVHHAHNVAVLNAYVDAIEVVMALPGAKTSLRNFTGGKTDPSPDDVARWLADGAQRLAVGSRVPAELQSFERPVRGSSPIAYYQHGRPFSICVQDDTSGQNVVCRCYLQGAAEFERTISIQTLRD